MKQTQKQLIETALEDMRNYFEVVSKMEVALYGLIGKRVTHSRCACCGCGIDVDKTWYDAQRDEMRGQCELVCHQEVRALEN